VLATEVLVQPAQLPAAITGEAPCGSTAEMVEEILAAMVHPLVPVPDHTMLVSMPGVPELYQGWPEPLSPVDVQLKGCPPTDAVLDTRNTGPGRIAT
jgi:hypothetical protein